MKIGSEVLSILKPFFGFTKFDFIIKFAFYLIVLLIQISYSATNAISFSTDALQQARLKL